MSSVQLIAKNTFVSLFGDLTFRLMSLLITIYLAQYLGVENYGIYNFVFAFLSLFGIIKNLGLHDILGRDMAQDPTAASRLIGNAYFVKIIMSLIAIILCITTISLSSYSKEVTNYVYVASITILFTSFSDFYTVIFQVNYKNEYDVFSNLIFKVVSISLMFLVIYYHGTLMQFFLVSAFSEMVRTFVSYSLSRRLIKPQFEIDYKLWKYFAYEATPIALASLIYIINYRTDIIMLSAIMGNFEVGIYSAAYKLVEPFSMISLAVIGPLFPHMASTFKESEVRFLHSYNLSMKYLNLILIPTVVGITLMADKIILMIYKDSFIESVNVLQILIWTLVFSSNVIFTKILIVINKQKCIAKSMTISTVLNIILNYLLIPSFSYIGASVATLLSSVIIFSMSHYYIGKHFKVLPIFRLTVKPLIGSLVMAVYLYYVTDNIILMITGGFLIYIITLVIIETFNDEDKEIFKKLIGQINWLSVKSK